MSDLLTPEVLSLLRTIKADRVLDLGSGNGFLCSKLSAAGYNVVGVEVDEGGVKIAQATYPNIPFYQYSVEDDPSELMRTEEPFDVVVSTEVIEHLFSPHLLPIYAARVLKPGGHLIVSTPYHGYLKNLVLSLTNTWDRHHTSLWHGGHIKFWSRTTLTLLLEQNGFNHINFRGVGRLPYLWKSMVILAALN